MLRRISSAAVAAVALLVAFGCGGTGNDASVKTGTSARGGRIAAADGTATTPDLKTVSYGGIEFDVPSSWPVHDLAADPTTCVRFDVNAVYLGRPSDEMQCPAGIIGRADALLVEPTGDASAADAASGTAPDLVAAASASGLAIQVADDTTNSQVEATVPTAGITLTATYQDSDATAQQVVQSLRTGS